MFPTLSFLTRNLSPRPRPRHWPAEDFDGFQPLVMKHGELENHRIFNGKIMENPWKLYLSCYFYGDFPESYVTHNYVNVYQRVCGGTIHKSRLCWS